MELAVAALGSVLPKLGTLLSGEYKLQKGVRGEIKFLQVEMESMQAVLSVLSECPADQITKLDKIWIRKLKELSYDIEDSIDTFMVRIDAQGSAKPHSFRRFFDRTIGLLTKGKTRHHIANDIEDIKKRINEVAARRERYNKLERVAARPDTTIDQRRAMACFEHATKLVGTDVPVERICDLLTNENGLHDQKRMVVSIVGVGGLGKTTVANLVYERLGGQFDCHSFISVSLRPNMTQILSKILRQVGSTNTVGEADLDELIRKIREFLKDKRYFIVIDDVWSEEAWKTIEGALIDNNLGSRIILTTRNAEVARSSSIDGAMYPLDPLSDEDSEELLSKRIFNEDEGIPSHLEEVAKNILKKCSGVPLAIITIASMLASIPDKTKFEWYRVYKSMGCGLQKDNKNLESMREILCLSYGDLPPYLKPCLLYLSIFPEDYEIPRLDLIRMWVGEGFIDGEQESNLYDLGERYFRELVNRSMIQPVNVDFLSGTPRFCRVHDMILDLIITLSAQENFVTIAGGPQDISSACKIRRLSLQGNEVDTDEEDSKKEKVILPATATSHVRTLVTFGDAFQWIPPLSSFPLLRVLVLLEGDTNTLQGLGSMHHLRYLKLGGGVETEHLEEIGSLKHLKTLDLWATNIKELPASIVQLRQLECLVTDDKVKFPDGMGNLVSLQQLAVLDVSTSPHTLEEFGVLIGLRMLAITGINESCVNTFLWNLNNLHNIHTLNLWKIKTEYSSLDCVPDQWSGPARLQYFSGDGILKVPRWFSSLSELSCLDIEVHILIQDDLQLLGALPVLRSLKIFVDGSGTTDERLVIGTDQPFRSLTSFKFKHYTRCLLVFAEGVMPKLETLEVYIPARPRGGGAFDAGLENLTSLKQVKVRVDCKDATITEVQDVETKVRDTIARLPNHPTLDISRERPLIESDSEASEQQSSDMQDSDHECNKGSKASEQSDSEASEQQSLDLQDSDDECSQGSEAEASEQRSDLQDTDDERNKGSEASEQSPA